MVQETRKSNKPSVKLFSFLLPFACSCCSPGRTSEAGVKLQHNISKRNNSVFLVICFPCLCFFIMIMFLLYFYVYFNFNFCPFFCSFSFPVLIRDHPTGICGERNE